MRPPKKHAIRVRKGKPIRVDPQILTWREKKGPDALRKTLLDARGLVMSDHKPKVRGKIWNPFG